MNKFIALTLSLLSLAFATMAEAGAFRIPPNDKPVTETVIEIKPVDEVNVGADSENSFYLESHQGGKVLKTLESGKHIFMLETSDDLTPSQIFKCFQDLKIEDITHGTILVKTAGGRQGQIKFLGIRSTLMSGSTPAELYCN